MRKRAAAFLADTDGEQVRYRPYPSLEWLTVDARLEREPPSPDGNVLKNTIELYVSKTNVPEVHLKLDEIEVLADQKADEEPPLYTPEEVLEGREPTVGHWLLRCVR